MPHLSRLERTVFRVLCIHTGEKLSQSAIAELSNATPQGVAKALRTLTELNLATVERDPRLNLNRASLHAEAIPYKRAENLLQLAESGLIEALTRANPAATVVLFGSYSRGEDTMRSDIDIAIIGPSREPRVAAFEPKLFREISINRYESFEHIHDQLRESLCNGIVLAGSIRWSERSTNTR